MKSRTNVAEIISIAKQITSPSHFKFFASISAWVASIVLIMYPTIGVTTPVYPPKPVPGYQFILLVITTCFASLYSAIIGYRLLKE